MRIGIDARLWNETGVGRYIRNLVAELQTIDTKNQYVLFVKEGIRSQELGIRNENWKVVETDIRWHTVEEQLLFYKVLENEYLDLVHFPYFSIPIMYNRPFVITIHDLIINHFPTGKASTLPLPIYYLKRMAYQFILKQAAKKASAVITVSEATRKEIVDHLSVAKDKVVVTYEGVDAVLHGKGKSGKGKGPEIASSYFLYVGNAYPHKNVERLVEAFQLVLEKHSDARLVMVGKKNYFYNRLEEKVQAMHLEKSILFTGGVDDAALKKLYQNAKALVFPSLMEGFGLPGLEAMQLQCLVLASDIPVFKEIYADAAVYFNPLEIQDMSDTMLKVLDDKKSFDTYLRRGEKQASQYSWHKMAHETVSIYENSISVRQSK